MDLWEEASRDLEAEHLALRMASAKVAVAGLWPFLALAQSEREFEHRIALANDHIANAVPVDLLHPVVESLREDFRAIAAKDAEGEEKADDEDGDGKPDWLQKKIKGEGAFFHQGRQAWVRIAAEDEKPTRQELEASEPKSTQQHTEDPDEDAYWDSLGKQAVYWHAGARRWVTAEVEDHPGGGNPYYFTGGPEAGPNTGQTNQFPPHPTGADPVDPINGMFPMQPSPWTVPPGGEWKEEPMQFNPPGGGYHPASRRPFVAAEVGDRSTCANCRGPIKRVKTEWSRNGAWTHTGEFGLAGDDDHEPIPHQSREGAWKLAEEGVSGRPGPNPHFFDGGGEGASGDQQSGFPTDVAQGVDPEDRMNELYGAQPLSAGTFDGGHRVSYHLADLSPEHPAPNSNKLQGTEFDSPQERQRWNTAEDPTAQQPSRDSTALTGSRRAQFFDPTDPTVRVLGTGGYGADNPFTPGQDASAPQAPQVGGGMGGGMGMPGGGVPQTTAPRQMPGAGGMGGGTDPIPGSGSTSDDAAKQQSVAMRRHADGDSLERPTAENPYGTDDPFDAKTWDTVKTQRPMVGLEHMNFNGPQNPNARERIRTTQSPEQQGGVRDSEREASLIAARAIRELVQA